MKRDGFDGDTIRLDITGEMIGGWDCFKKIHGSWVAGRLNGDDMELLSDSNKLLIKLMDITLHVCVCVPDTTHTPASVSIYRRDYEIGVTCKFE